MGEHRFIAIIIIFALPPRSYENDELAPTNQQCYYDLRAAFFAIIPSTRVSVTRFARFETRTQSNAVGPAEHRVSVGQLSISICICLQLLIICVLITNHY